MFKCGFISVIGLPNVGKSTLLNQLVGKKVTIVSPKPQTTRARVRAIKTTQNFQMIFIDTPGVKLNASDLLNRQLQSSVCDSLKEIDLVLFIIDASAGIKEKDRHLLEWVKKIINPKSPPPVLLVLNKIDKIAKEKLLPVIDFYRGQYTFADYIPISALKGSGLSVLEEVIYKYLPEGEPVYPQEVVTDQDQKFWSSEIIREKVFQVTHQEIPYSVMIEVEDIFYRKEKDLIQINATIYVEKNSQKGIIIGKGGEKLKKIGQLSREEIEFVWGKKVYLSLWVKVKEKWRQREEFIKRF